MTDALDASLNCPAYRVIDQADGIEDGNLFPVLVKQVGDERRIRVRLPIDISRTQLGGTQLGGTQATGH
ncbi:MAG: hypothetical protein M3083_12715 [Actinomycetota bacterium]|nr:hypothetical protein [Actinomycetota bacterium]MDQ6945002.1 hypothetical protein [Actinomycetota bacterium]